MACRETGARHGGPAVSKEPSRMAKKGNDKQKAKRDAGKSRHRPRNGRIVNLDELPKR